MEENKNKSSNKKIYIILVIVFILLILLIVGVLFIFKDNTRVTGQEDKVLVIGDKTKLDLFAEEAEKVAYISSDESIVKIDQEGNIEAIGTGTVTITVITEDDEEEYVITVIEPSKVVIVKKIELSKTSLSLKVGEMHELTYKISPSNATNKEISWTSSDNKIATVENGIVKGLKNGTVTITAKNGKASATCIVKVTGEPVKLTGISLDTNNITLSVGDSYYIDASFEPTNATNKDLVWSSSNQNVATVKDGLITAHWGGSTTITAKNEETGVSKSIMVTVKNYNLLLSKHYLKTSGTKIVNQKNEEVVLRGFNLGVWLSKSFSLMQVKALAPNKESFLKMGYSCINGVAFNEILNNNFGTINARNINDVYYQNFITASDLDLIAQSGANVVRVPFEYGLFLNEKDSSGNYTYKSAEDIALAWKYLDWIITECGKRGIYVILDMHVVPGRQNQGGWCENYTFFEDAKAQNAVVDLWKQIASRYKSNQAVAGYDLINEPQAKVAVLEPIYNKIYKAIRSVDSRHIIFMEENCVYCGYTDPDVKSKKDVIGALPRPSKYNWQNVVYSTHDYFYNRDPKFNNNIDTTTSVAVLKQRMKIKTDKIVAKRADYNVPYYVGEFSHLGTTENLSTYKEAWKYGMDLYDKYNISYTPWSYKASWEPYFGLIYYGTKLNDLEPNSQYVTSGKYDFVNSKDLNITLRVFSYTSNQAMRFNPTYYQMFLEQYKISSTGGRLATTVNLDCNNVEIIKDQTKTINYTVGVDPNTVVNGFKTYDVINKKVVWSSEKTSVATIDKETGKITAKKAGTATIVATLKPSVYSDTNKNIVAKCTITVKEK